METIEIETKWTELITEFNLKANELAARFFSAAKCGQTHT